VIGELGFHRKGHTQRLVNPTETVMGEGQPWLACPQANCNSPTLPAARTAQ